MSCYQVKVPLRHRPRRSEAASLGGPAGRGPGPPPGGPPARSAPPLRFVATIGRGGGRASGPPLLRTPRPLLRRGPCPCAGPLRRAAPAAPLRFASAGRPAPPRLSRSASRRPCCAAGLRSALAAVVWPPVRAPPAAGFLFGRPCSASRSLRSSAPARRVPPARARFAASARAAPGPGGSAASPRSCPPAPRAFCGCARRPGGACCHMSGSWFSWTRRERKRQLVQPFPSR